MSDAILFHVDEGLAHLTLNRPTRLNAFNADLAVAWRDATAEATSRDDVRAILLDAASPSCSHRWWSLWTSVFETP